MGVKVCDLHGDDVVVVFSRHISCPLCQWQQERESYKEKYEELVRKCEGLTKNA